MKLTWLTDIHLNFLKVEARKAFYQSVVNKNSDVILISGDIAEAPSVSDLLKEMAEYIKKPIYFVLGNHDYYSGQVSEVRHEMAKLTKKEKLLNWLPICEPIILEDNIVLVGHDGWADGRFGDYTNSIIRLNDERMIADLFQAKLLGKFSLLEKMQEFADSDAKELNEKLYKAIEQYKPKKIIVLMHIPPFKEVCMHKGKISDDSWLPYFSSKIMGDILLEIARKNAGVQFEVLCGHTHSEAFYQPLQNLVVKVGRAEYFAPKVQSRS